MKTLVTALLLVALAGCARPYQDGEIVHGNEKSFPGLSEILREGGGVDVIAIHGMCTHTEEWAKKAGERVSVNMAAGKPKSDAQMDAHKSKEGLRVLKTVIDARNVDVYAILWSPLTKEHKESLCQDSGMTTRSCPDAGNRSQSPEYRRQAYFNNWAKSKLMNDCLADAMVYAGDAGKEIREEVQSALEAINYHRSNNSVVVIAESLGSNIIADVIYERRSTKALNAFTGTRVIFLAANQIKMLDLAHPEGGKSLLDVLKNEDKLIGDARQVAFTDPNDVLSYETEPLESPSHINIRVSNDLTYFGLLENPYKAHTGYLENDTVWEYIMCGHNKDCRE